jgi:hypothetical protein
MALDNNSNLIHQLLFVEMVLLRVSLGLTDYTLHLDIMAITPFRV